MTRSSRNAQTGIAPLAIVLIVAVVLAGAGAAYYLMGRTSPTSTMTADTAPADSSATGTSDASDTDAASTSPAGSEATGEIRSSAPDIIARGQKLECTFQIPDAPQFQPGKLYTDGVKGRSSVQGSASGIAIDANAIYDGTDVYSWVTAAGSTTAMKFTQAEIADMDASMTAEQRQQAEQIRREMIFDCVPWTVDPSVFILPTGVTFN